MNNLIFIDLEVLRYIDPSVPNKLYWEDSEKIDINRNDLVDIFLNLGIEFSPGVLRRIRQCKEGKKLTRNIKLQKQDGTIGWFRILDGDN